MAKNLNVDIDTGKFLESFRPEMPAPACPKEETGDAAKKDTAPAGRRAERRKRDTGVEEEYLERFLHAPKAPIRSGKTAYIRKTYHERIQRIVQVIGKNELSLSVYVDRVLEEHFRDYEEVIRKLYRNNYEDVY